MQADVLLEYARDAARILRRSAALFDAGEIAFYRVMAVELRLLLCDSTRIHDARVDLSVLPGLFPDLVIPALDRGTADEGRVLPAAAWLEQTVEPDGSTRVSLRQLIRQVCDQDGGAHVDRRGDPGHPRLHASRARLIRAASGAVLEALAPRLGENLHDV